MTVKVGSFGTSTAAAGNNVVVSGLGFTPDLVLFFWSGLHFSTEGASDNGPGIGWATSASARRAVGAAIRNAQDPYLSNRVQYDDACIAVTSALLGSVDGLLDLVSMDSDGFTLVIDNQFSLDFKIGYMAFKGITNVIMGTLTEPAATGNQATSGLGFQPDAVFFASISSAAALPTFASNAKLSFGAMTATHQYSTAVFDDDNTGGSVHANYLYDAECIALGTDGDGTALNGRASRTSLDSDGFTVNWLERAGSRKVFWLAVKGGNWALGDILSQTGTSNTAETGLGFGPQGVMFISHCNAKNAQDTPGVLWEWSVGAATGPTERAALASSHPNALGAANHKTSYNTTEIYTNFGPSSADLTVDGRMDLVSLDSDGFTFVMDDADPAQAFIWYIAFEQVALVPRTRLVKYLHNTYISRDAGRPIVHDVLGREVPVEQIQADQWLYADGPLFLTSARPQSLISDPRAYYIESLTSRGDKVDIVTAREGLLENLFRRLSRSG
jgi:hypothetical protein